MNTMDSKMGWDAEIDSDQVPWETKLEKQKQNMENEIRCFC